MKIPPSVLSYIPLQHYYAIKRPLSLRTNEIRMFRPKVDRYWNNRRRTRFFLKSSGEKYKFSRKITRANYEHQMKEKEFSTSSINLAEKNVPILRNSSWYSICDRDKRPNSRSSTRRSAKRLTATRNTCLSKQTKTRLSSSITIIQIDLNSLNRLCLNHLLQT